jgi:hypothetical protein
MRARPTDPAQNDPLNGITSHANVVRARPAVPMTATRIEVLVELKFHAALVSTMRSRASSAA